MKYYFLEYFYDSADLRKIEAKSWDEVPMALAKHFVEINKYDSAPEEIEVYEIVNIKKMNVDEEVKRLCKIKQKEKEKAKRESKKSERRRTRTQALRAAEEQI